MEWWLWPVGLGVLGLVFGSFIATVAIRWPEGESALKGRSHCDACGKTLRSHELVPVLSHVLQSGKCRRCGGRIAPLHLWVELAGAAVGVSAGLVAPDPTGVIGAAFGWLLLTAAALDAVAMWLPNRLMLAIALLGLGLGDLTWFGPDLVSRLIGGAAGFGSLWLVAAGYRALRGHAGLGGGDPKLFGAIGLWTGWQALPFVLLAACFTGLAAVALMLLAGRRIGRMDRLPFGVMLALGAWLIALWPEPSL